MAVSTMVGANIFFSVFSVLGYTALSDWQLFGLPLNDLADYFSNQILLPLGGLLIAIFAGWFMSRESSREELDLKSEGMYKLWYFLLRWPVPVAVAIILFMGLSE